VNTVAKVARAVRLTPETVERVKSLASSLGRSEQSVLESAVEAFLDDAEGGTPDVVEEPAGNRPPAHSSPEVIDRIQKTVRAGARVARASPQVGSRDGVVGVSADIGVGDCPNRPDGFGHVWRSARDDSRRSCKFCGRPGRDNTPIGGVHDTGGFFAEATASRSATVGG
jgi:hypothetical protein